MVAPLQRIIVLVLGATSLSSATFPSATASTRPSPSISNRPATAPSARFERLPPVPDGRRCQATRAQHIVASTSRNAVAGAYPLLSRGPQNPAPKPVLSTARPRLVPAPPSTYGVSWSLPQKRPVPFARSWPSWKIVGSQDAQDGEKAGGRVGTHRSQEHEPFVWTGSEALAGSTHRLEEGGAGECVLLREEETQLVLTTLQQAVDAVSDVGDPKQFAEALSRYSVFYAEKLESGINRRREEKELEHTHRCLGGKRWMPHPHDVCDVAGAVGRSVCGTVCGAVRVCVEETTGVDPACCGAAEEDFNPERYISRDKLVRMLGAQDELFAEGGCSFSCCCYQQGNGKDGREVFGNFGRRPGPTAGVR